MVPVISVSVRENIRMKVIPDYTSMKAGLVCVSRFPLHRKIRDKYKRR